MGILANRYRRLAEGVSYATDMLSATRPTPPANETGHIATSANPAPPIDTAPCQPTPPPANPAPSGPHWSDVLCNRSAQESAAGRVAKTMNVPLPVPRDLRVKWPGNHAWMN